MAIIDKLKKVIIFLLLSPIGLVYSETQTIISFDDLNWSGSDPSSSRVYDKGFRIDGYNGLVPSIYKQLIMSNGTGYNSSIGLDLNWFTEVTTMIKKDNGSVFTFDSLYLSSSSLVITGFNNGTLVKSITTTQSGMVDLGTDFSDVDSVLIQKNTPGGFILDALHFHSDDSETPSGCGNTTLTAASGTFSDGSGDSDYENNQDCSWLVQVEDGNTIELSFTSFDTENTDVVGVFDGNNENSPMIGVFSGSSIPNNITSTSNELLIIFRTDGSTTNAGWEASYTSSSSSTGCGNTTLTAASGTFSDGSGESNYENDQDCSWLIQVEDGNIIELSFTSFNTEYDYDFVTVYDGNSAVSTSLGTFSGSSIPGNITSSGNELYITFTSDGSETYAGWEASYYSAGTILTSATGSLSDGSGESNYENDENSSWLIQVEDGNIIELNFTSFDTEEGFDFVKVYDGNSTTSTSLGTFSGSSIPDNITSSGNELFITFTSDENETYAGWEASYTSTPSRCETILTNAYGYFSDGSGESNYEYDQDCSWLIQVEDGNIIELSFTSFDTEYDFDFVKVYDGNSTESTHIGTFSGSSIPDNITSSGNELFITFTSDDYENYAGWEATYTSFNVSGCGNSTLIFPSGSFSDGSGESNYENNQDCSWLIQVEDDNIIDLSFTSFYTEEGYDFVTVYDGNSSASTILGTFSGSSIPDNITSSGNELYITFISNESTTNAGWEATYSSAGTILTFATGSLSDGSGESNYENDENSSWLIQVGNDSIIELSFTSFDTEYNYDFVTVYDGNSTASTPLGTFSGINIPDNITSSGNELFITFTSDESTTKAGWEATYTSDKDPVSSANSNLIEKYVSSYYPNPFIDEITITFNTTLSRLEISLTNIQGQTLYSEVYDQVSNQVTLPLNDLPKGFYLLNLKSNDITGTIKVTK